MAVERKTRWHYLYFHFITTATGMPVSAYRNSMRRGDRHILLKVIE